MAHLAAAYAESGRFEDAITIQKGVIASLNKKGKTEDLAEYERQLKAYEAHKPWRTSVSRGEDLERKAESSTQREPVIRQKIHKETFPAEESSASTVSKRLETLRGSTERVFFVQVGAFVLRENAEKERARLKKMGYTPHVLAVSDSEGKVWHQVLMGEYTTRQQAKEAAANFSAKENMPSCVFVFKAP